MQWLSALWLGSSLLNRGPCPKPGVTSALPATGDNCPMRFLFLTWRAMSSHLRVTAASRVTAGHGTFPACSEYQVLPQETQVLFCLGTNKRLEKATTND